MDAIRVPKVGYYIAHIDGNTHNLIYQVSDVLCSKAGKTSFGTLYLTAHHLIFSFNDEVEPEMWASYSVLLWPAGPAC